MTLAKEVKQHLEEKIIPFWKGLRDNEHGGYYGYVDYDLNVQKEHEKGCILNSRILWFFSNACLALGDDSLLEEAAHAYRFLKDVCFDQEYGGVYWSADYDGNIADSTKHTYNQAFAIYALSSYYEAAGDKEALELAMELFERIETTCVDEYGYLESFTRDWRPENNEKLSENGLLADKTMNTLLHILEAYTELYRVSGNDDVRERLEDALRTFRNKVYNPDKKQLEVFFDAGLNTISDLYSYGHDIEASWLLDRACEVLQVKELEDETKEYTNVLAETVCGTALDIDGSMKNECFRGEVDTTRVWWVQAEAMVGFYNMYQKTSDERFLKATEGLWNYIKKYVVDQREGSEWFWELDKDGKPESGKPIVEPWKCPYHNGRMCLEMMRRIV